MIPRPPRSTPFPSPTLFRSSRGPVRGDALVDRDANQLDLAPAPQELDQEGRRRARILAAAHADRDALVAAKIDLGAERSEEHTSELQSQSNLVCRLLLEKKQ